MSKQFYANSYVPKALVAVQTDHRVFAVFQQQRIVAALAIGDERELAYRQRAHALPVRGDRAEVAAVVVEIVHTVGGRNGVGALESMRREEPHARH